MEISEKDYELAISMVQKYRNTSLSYLQRKLGWGFARAYAAMCRMEKEFVVGPLMLSGRREAYPIEMHQLWKELQKAKAQEVPEGFVLVPREPTDVMLDAGYNDSYDAKGHEIPEIYKAMIEAAEKEMIAAQEQSHENK